jgi:hypothetical protein
VPTLASKVGALLPALIGVLVCLGNWDRGFRVLGTRQQRAELKGGKQKEMAVSSFLGKYLRRFVDCVDSHRQKERIHPTRPRRGRSEIGLRDDHASTCQIWE